jgi:hypothetical protein
MGAGEAHEAGLRQGVAHVAGEAVDEVVLAAVGLVGDDDDVAPVRKHGVAVARLGGHELLDRREDDASADYAELLAQVGAVGGLDGILAPQVAAAGEGAEDLVVQVVSVGDDDDRRVLHRRIEDQPPGVEGHAQALAGTLGVPDAAGAWPKAAPDGVGAVAGLHPTCAGDRRIGATGPLRTVEVTGAQTSGSSPFVGHRAPAEHVANELVYRIRNSETD